MYNFKLKIKRHWKSEGNSFWFSFYIYLLSTICILRLSWTVRATGNPLASAAWNFKIEVAIIEALIFNALAYALTNIMGCLGSYPSSWFFSPKQNRYMSKQIFNRWPKQNGKKAQANFSLIAQAKIPEPKSPKQNRKMFFPILLGSSGENNCLGEYLGGCHRAKKKKSAVLANGNCLAVGLVCAKKIIRCSRPESNDGTRHRDYSWAICEEFSLIIIWRAIAGSVVVLFFGKHKQPIRFKHLDEK